MRGRLLLYVVACAWCAWQCRAGYDPELKVEAARLYGDLAEFYYWFLDVLVGEPPQRVSVILDSGSSLLAFPCTGCSHCGSHHIDPMFNFSKSTTASWLGCDRCHGRCNSDRHCTYSQGYVEGSKITGVLFEDLLTLGDSIQNNPPVKAKLGCHTKEDELFYTQAANGILGIEGADSVIHTYYKDRKDIASNIMAICLAHHGGHFSIGGYNRSRHRGDVQWLHQLDSERFLVNLKRLEVGGKTLTSGFGRALIDSGTTFAIFTKENYKKVVEGIEEACAEGRCGESVANTNRTCWRSSSLTPFPTMVMYFGEADTKVEWKPWNYLYFVKRYKVFCYAFEGYGKAPRTTLGASWMIEKDIIFDKGNKKIGVVDANCPEHRDRPAPPRQDKSTSTTRSSRSSTTTTVGEDEGSLTSPRPATKASPPGSMSSSATTSTTVHEGMHDKDDFMPKLTNRPKASIFGAASFVDQLWQDGPMFISVFLALALLMCCFTRMCLRTFERARRLRQDGDVF